MSELIELKVFLVVDPVLTAQSSGLKQVSGVPEYVVSAVEEALDRHLRSTGVHVDDSEVKLLSRKSSS